MSRAVGILPFEPSITASWTENISTSTLPGRSIEVNTTSIKFSYKFGGAKYTRHATGNAAERGDAATPS